MKRRALLAIIICYCGFSFSQQLTFSRKFESVGRNIPVAMINAHPDFFYVLRYNKVVHDFTIECRAKPTAEIIGFTALKLDEINDNRFNYEKLDYLFFEKNKSLYFLFEKVLNTKKTIYLKIIDSLHHSSGFIELANLTLEKGMEDIGFEFKTTFDNNILIIASKTYYNSVTKTAVLYNIQKQRMEWFKKLAIENERTGYSSAFECNSMNDLFFTLIKSHVSSYERKYMHHMQMQVPVIYYDDVILVAYLHNDPANIHLKYLPGNASALNNVKISIVNDEPIVQAHYAIDQLETRDKKVFFLSTRMTRDLSREIYATTTNLNEALKKQLTFYDGTDSKYAGDKHYSSLRTFGNGDFNYQLSERKDDTYYKELLLVRTDLSTGLVLNQYVVLRKAFSEALTTRFHDDIYIVTAEAATNFKKPAAEARYNKFKKEGTFWGSNLVLYTLSKEGNIGKTLISNNSTLGMTWTKYYGDNQDNIIFYEEINGYERFGTLDLSVF